MGLFCMSLNLRILTDQVDDIVKCVAEIHNMISAKYTSIRRMDIRDYFLSSTSFEPVNILVTFVMDDVSRVDIEDIEEIAMKYGFEIEFDKTSYRLIKKNT